MRSLSVHSNHYKKSFTLFFYHIRKKKCQAYQQRKEKQNLILMIWLLETKFNLPSGALLSTERISTEYNSAESLESLTSK